MFAIIIEAWIIHIIIIIESNTIGMRAIGGRGAVGSTMHHTTN
jgi:hypothetical protein